MSLRGSEVVFVCLWYILNRGPNLVGIIQHQHYETNC